MRKLFALYLNELIKTTRKVSIIIILSITVLLVVGAGALMRYEKYQQSKYAGYSSDISKEEMQKQSIQQQLSSTKSQLSQVQTKLKTATDEEKVSLQAQETQLQQQIDQFQYAADHNFGYSSSDFRWQALEQLNTYKSEVAAYKDIPLTDITADLKKKLDQDNAYIAKLQKAMDDNDYSAYIDFENLQVSNNDAYSADEKKIYTDTNNLKLKYDPKGQDQYNGSAVGQLIANSQSYRLALLNNVDDTQGTTVPMTEEKRQEITNKLAVNDYKLTHRIGLATNTNADTSTSGIDWDTNAITLMYAFGNLMLVILMMILAGSTVSQELSTGSIKSLIISPARRWKILTAKFFALLTVLIAGGLLVYCVAALTHGALFGFASGTPYVYAVGGVAHEMSFPLYNFAYFFAELIEVFVYMVLAMMLSIVTKNTAASVGISMAVFFGGSIVTAILNQFASGEWIKFVPFNNLGIAAKLFPDAAKASMQVGFSSSSVATAGNTSLHFALIYLAVMVFCLGYIGFDSFTRRDIK